MFVLPPSPREWLRDDHLVYFVLDVLQTLDISAIEQKLQDRDARGNQPHHPRMMVGLVIYGYCVGVRSSRKIERATYEDVPFRVLAGGAHPDHTRISEFRREHLADLKALFLEVLCLCREAGLVRLGHVALDGTKVQANASKHKAMSYAGMNKAEAELQREIEEILADAEAQDQTEDERYGKGNRGGGLPEELRRREDRLKKIQEAKKKLEAEAAATRARELKERAREKRRLADTAPEDEEARRRRLANKVAGQAGAATAGANRKAREAGEPPPDLSPASDAELPFHEVKSDRHGKPKPKAQRNFTDPDSGIMVKAGEFLQAYNCQTAVDGEHLIIVAECVTNQAADAPHFSSMLDSVKENTGAVPEVVSADTGYCSEENIIAGKELGTDPHIATGRKKYSGPPTEIKEGPPPENLSEREQMAHKLQTVEGHKIYSRRKCIAEPVFGQIKEARGMRRFLLRGLEKVGGEWSLICLGHNLLKLFSAVRSGATDWRPAAVGA